MYWPIVAIKIEPIEGEVGDDPICNVSHAFVINDEITCGAKSVANRVTLAVDLVRGVLIKFRSHSSRRPDINRVMERNQHFGNKCC